MIKRFIINLIGGVLLLPNIALAASISAVAIDATTNYKDKTWIFVKDILKNGNQITANTDCSVLIDGSWPLILKPDKSEGIWSTHSVSIDNSTFGDYFCLVMSKKNISGDPNMKNLGPYKNVLDCEIYIDPRYDQRKLISATEACF